MAVLNEHAARQTNPRKYVRVKHSNSDHKASITRHENQLGPGIHAMRGWLDQYHSELQSVRFDAQRYTVEQAKAWLQREQLSDDVRPAALQTSS